LLFAATINQDDGYFWHDALSFMTTKDTVDWMKQEGYNNRWLLPELYMYKCYPEVKKIYNGRPIGNTPESMPLNDNSNQGLHNDVSRQVAGTMLLEETDKRKFSTSTPNELTTAYLKVWNCDGPSHQGLLKMS
jgi:hypothetical protein